jgi:molybdopterin-guanine dinucleotide biosynthesis protein A
MCLCHDVRVPSSDVCAAIVAGGQARRFGGADKSRLIVEGRPIIVRQLEVLRRITPSVAVIANDAARFADLGLPVHADVIPGAGALGGLYTALVHATTDRVLVVAGDLPFLDDRLLSHLAQLASGADGAWVRTVRGPEPFLACYQRNARDRVRGELDAGHLRAGDLAHVLTMVELDEAAVAEFGPVSRLLANVNTPDDHARIQ